MEADSKSVAVARTQAQEAFGSLTPAAEEDEEGHGHRMDPEASVDPLGGVVAVVAVVGAGAGVVGARKTGLESPEDAGVAAAQQEVALLRLLPRWAKHLKLPPRPLPPVPRLPMLSGAHLVPPAPGCLRVGDPGPVPFPGYADQCLLPLSPVEQNYPSHPWQADIMQPQQASSHWTN